MNIYVPMTIVSVLAMVFVGIMSVAFNTTDVLENISIDFLSIEALLTLGAIAVAIYMPKRIADKQNNITLFEKRYELYSRYIIFFRKAAGGYNFFKFEFNSNGFDKESFAKGSIWELIQTIDIAKTTDISMTSINEKQRLRMELEYMIANFIIELEKIKYLFSLSKEEIATLDNIITELIYSPVYLRDDKIEFEEFKEKVLALYKCIKDPTILIKMQHQLQLSSEVK